jgi:predicted TPR repeat methyltransferase
MAGGSVTDDVPPAVLRQLEAAKVEHQQGRYAEARHRYQHILERNPGLTQALHFLGVLEHMDGNSEIGLSLLQRAFQRSPDDYDIRKNLSNVLSDMNRSEEAARLCRELVAERPSDPTNHSNYSIALRKLGHFAEAIASAHRAVELAPQSPVVRLALANALTCAGEFKEAVQAYERVISLKPNFSPAHNSLCQVLLQIEQAGIVSRFRLSGTRQAYRNWLDAVPGHPTAMFILAAIEQRKAPKRMPDAVVKSTFDAYAEEFDRHIHSLGYRAPELVAKVLALRLPTADASLDVLDGGCGTGLAAPMLRPYARHLTGIDLSSAMLDRAHATVCYDDLQEAELGDFLEAHRDSFDVCVFVDVLTYFGDLHAIVLSAARALRAGGLLAFSVEKSSRLGSHLHPTGRYAQHSSHVQAALAGAGLLGIEQVEATIRSEGNAPVTGLIVSAQRPALNTGHHDKRQSHDDPA